MPAVQTTYFGALTPALLGMVATMEEANIYTRVSAVPLPNTIGFGVPVARGTTDTSVVRIGDAGSGRFLGITILDPTTRPQIVPDKYQLGDTVPIMTLGVVWVVANASVTPGQPAYYDGVGNLTNVAGAGAATGNIAFSLNPTNGSAITLNGSTVTFVPAAIAATGSIAFTVNPTAAQTMTLNGSIVTFVASGATGLQVNIGATLAATLVSLQALLQGSADAQLTKFGYAISGTTLLLNAVTAGVAGNALTTVTNVTGATASGATLTGGAAGATGLQSNLGATLALTLSNLLAMLTASADAQLVKFLYALSGTQLNLTAATAGTAENALTIATTVAGAVPTTGGLMVGGTATNTAIPQGEFDSTGAAGALVKLRIVI